MGPRTLVVVPAFNEAGNVGRLLAKLKEWDIERDTLFIFMNDNGGTVGVQVYNAGLAWLSDPGGVQDAPPPMRSGFAASVRRDTIPLLIAAAENTLTARSLPEDFRTDA